MATASDGLVGPAEKGPVETKKARERRLLKQGEEETANLWDAERDHYGQTNPRCCLNALSVLECDGEGCQSFFFSSSPLSCMSV